MNILAAQAVFITVFDIAFAGVDHEDAFATGRLFLVQHDDAGRNAGSVEQVGRQPDNSFDITFFNQISANFGFGIAAKQYAMRQNARALADTFE